MAILVIGDWVMPKSLFGVEWIRVGLPEPLLQAVDRYCAERTESRSDVARRCFAKEIGYTGPSDVDLNQARLIAQRRREHEERVMAAEREARALSYAMQADQPEPFDPDEEYTALLLADEWIPVAIEKTRELCVRNGVTATWQPHKLTDFFKDGYRQRAIAAGRDPEADIAAGGG